MTCVLLERLRLFGYGAELPESVRAVLVAYDLAESRRRNKRDTAVLVTQAAVLVFLIAGLALHLTAVGLIGVSVIILATSFLGMSRNGGWAARSRRRCRSPRCWWCSSPSPR
jgi:NhaB family Na+:H+ antiporter